MSRFWSPVVQTLSPYVPGEQPKTRTASSSSTPTRIRTRRRRACWRRLPRRASVFASIPIPRATVLREAIARHYDVAPEEVFVGNGSDEILAHTFQALLKHDAPLLFPDITYSFYPVYCRLYGVSYEEVPLDAAMRLQIADYRRPCSAILLANPNAPTGIALPRQAIEALLAEHPDQLVVIDEAYVDFGGESAVPLVARHDNLLVVQTLSKSRALAGLRVGFAIGQRPSDRGAGAGEGQFQFLSARLPCHRGRGRGDRGRCVVSGDAPAHHGKPRSRWCALSPASASRCCHRRRILCSRAIRGRSGAELAAGLARAWGSGAAFQEAADRELPAHHGRNRRAMRSPDCAGA